MDVVVMNITPIHPIYGNRNQVVGFGDGPDQYSINGGWYKLLLNFPVREPGQSSQTGQQATVPRYANAFLKQPQQKCMYTLVSSNRKAINEWVSLIASRYSGYGFCGVHMEQLNNRILALMICIDEYCLIYQPAYDAEGLNRTIVNFLMGHSLAGFNLDAMLQQLFTQYQLPVPQFSVFDIGLACNRQDNTLDGLSRAEFQYSVYENNEITTENFNNSPLWEDYITYATLRAQTCFQLGFRFKP